MSKNLIPKIAKMLGVELGEEFKIKGADTDYNEYTYFFADSGLKVKFDKHPDVIPSIAFAAVPDLLNGDAEVIKLPWKPKHKDKYWTFYINNHDKLDTDWNIWTEEVAELARLKAGWVYRTRAEAEAALPAVAKEIGVEYEL